MPDFSKLSTDELLRVEQIAGPLSIRQDPDAALEYVIAQDGCPRCHDAGGASEFDPCPVCGCGPDYEERAYRRAAIRNQEADL